MGLLDSLVKGNITEDDSEDQIIIFDELPKQYIDLPPGSEVLQLTEHGVVVRLPDGKIRVIR